MTHLISKLFFFAPTWLLRLVTWRKNILINGQILDYQTQIFLALQALQGNAFESIESAAHLRKILDTGRDGLPLNASPVSPVHSQDHIISSNGLEISVREYLPANARNQTTILYFHGGGYVIGNLDSCDGWLKLFSSSMEANIFSLDYRLSPENKFPASLEDANLALEWIASTYDLPISAIGLCGDSAGAHLAASLSTYRSMNGLELPHSQCLIYPMIDPACSSGSQKDFATGYFLTHDIMRWFWEQFLQSQENLLDPCFNLLQDHSNPLPKTLIITAGFDPLCDEGEDYARKIHAAGNDVEQIHYPHLIHGFVNMTALREAKKASMDLSKTYKTYFKS